VEVLLVAGAKPDPAREVLSAAGLNHSALAILQLLEEYGADIHKVFINEFTGAPMNALSQAKSYNNQDVVDYLLSKGARLPEKPSSDTENKPEIVSLCESVLGPADSKSLIEIVPTEPAIAIHCVPPGEGRDYVTLFTSGMSNRPMEVPEGGEQFSHAELFIQLPPNWKHQKIDDPEYGWPIHWLRSNAKYPHQNDTWLGGPVCLVANGDPPEPISPNADFTTLLLIAANKVTTSDGRLVQLYQMFPLFTDERQLEIEQGVHALMKALDEAGISFVVDMKRTSVA
jgi:hypothetical protein